MKKVIVSLVMMSVLSVMNAQTTVDISQGAGYMNDVFVSLENGEVSNPIATDWDISFNVISGFVDGIRINDGQNAEISIYPNGDIDDWNSVDTAGYSEWTRMRNSNEDWTVGALNQGFNPDNMFDFGWGEYTGDPDHDVIGDSLYIMTLVDGAHKKLRIDILDSGVWTFTHANIDGTNEVTETLAMADYPDRISAYYSMSNEEFIDREPAIEDWDMIFTRFYGNTAFGPGVTAGVLTNIGVQTLVSDTEVLDITEEGQPWIEENISEIGNGWRFLNAMFQWEITPDKYYYVKLASGCIYEITFLTFTGSETGDISYTTEKLNEVNVFENSSDLGVDVYPNPVRDQKIVNISFEKSTRIESFNIFDVQGRLVLSDQTIEGILNHEINVGDFDSGVYTLIIKTDQGIVQERIIIE